MKWLISCKTASGLQRLFHIIYTINRISGGDRSDKRQTFMPLLLSFHSRSIFPCFWTEHWEKKQAIAKHSLQCIHRANEKKALKVATICFSQLSQWPFYKLKKSVILILWVKIDIALMLSLQSQIASLNIATASH